MRDSQMELLETLEKHPRLSIKDLQRKGFKCASQRIRIMMDHGWLTRSSGRESLTNRKIRVYSLSTAGELVLQIEREWKTRKDGPRCEWDRRFTRRPNW